MTSVVRVLCALALVGGGCSQASGPAGSGGQGQGGSAVSGGTSGGAVGSGGAGGTGSKASSGGVTGSGGSGAGDDSGGAGGRPPGSGGAPGSGGTTSSGGATGDGGTSATSDAALRTDGAPSDASGDATSATGGRTSATGGTLATGGTIGGSGGSTGRTGGATSASGGATAGAGGGKLDGGGSGGITGTGGGTGVTVTLTPGTVWNDTQGEVIQAHGEGITRVGGTYYWIGEDKTNGSPFQNINCYSSTDLKNWTFVNNLLTRQSSGDLGPNRVIERPHVIFNAKTSQYVMYMHVDNSTYTDRKAGVATSASVCGSYSYRGSFKPLGNDSLDDTLFQDGTTGYFLSEDRTNVKLRIYQLADDYLTVASLVATLPQYESPAVVKIDGTYFIFGSHLTGWATNDNQYSTATSMAGPWGSWRSFAPAGTNTCNSQVTFILPVAGRNGTTYMFLGDRWNSNNLTDSRYIWQPLTITGTTVSMTCATSWTLDAG